MRTFAETGAKSEHLLRVATKVREWQMERTILGILKRVTPLLAVRGRDPPRSFEYLKRSSSAATCIVHA